MINKIREFENKLHPYFQSEGKHNLVRQIIWHTFHPYFLQKSKDIQEKFASHFERHIDIMTEYVMKYYIDNPNNISINFIKGLHKNIYGEIARVKIKTTGGEEEFMTPGEFKTTQNVISRLDKPETYLMCTTPENVKKEISELLKYIENSEINIYERCIKFFLTFTEIHPFPDDNGKIAMMIVDFLLVKNDLYPFFMSSYKNRNERYFYEIIQEYSHGSEKNLDIFYKLIIEGYDFLYKQKLMSSFYKNNYNTFLKFIENTDEKDILSGKIIDFLDSKFENTKSIAISNIGAGSGIVDKSIINYLRKQNKEFSYNYIEPSKNLIETFTENFNCENITFFEGNIENITLPKSDLIIVSHVLQYIDSLNGTINKLLYSLNPGGIILIVQPNIISNEVLFKERIEISYMKNITRIFPILQHIKENIFYEQVNSKIYNIQDVLKLNENGKNMISFFYNKPFEILDTSEIENIQKAISDLKIGNNLEKLEDYIWIEKN
ncbi:Fic family protein [Candidatus Gracilibacteria bacterium]|nr:Fic family protein [Candidatus Gracilibacteria bacterium]